MQEKSKVKWWQKAVFYQIYPRSFADGNGDGIGDFKGMISKLDYLKGLGIDAIWLSPHYPSPYIDCGYDISDYEDVAPEYGTLEEFQQFLDGAHSRGIRVVLDLVLNHTSDKHPWFIESRSRLDNPNRDWYIWKKGKNGTPPTNWYSTFGGSAWKYDPLTNEYYYHYFFVEQPDLNWKNPEVQKAMFDSARFWLDMGVDGFRLDAIGTIFEDETYPQLGPECLTQEELFRLDSTAVSAEDKSLVLEKWLEVFHNQVDKPEVHQITKDLRKVINEYDDRVLIGETDDIAFYGEQNDELHMNFNFPLMRTSRLTAEHIRNNQRQRLSILPAGAWPCNTLGNHDSPRLFSNYSDGEDTIFRARVFLMMLLTIKGTPFLYNGEEIGMSDLVINDPARFRDPLSNLNYELQKKVMGSSEEEAIKVGAERGRDKNRTPMQWSRSANAGFSPEGVEPWLPVNPDYKKGVNYADQATDPDSLFNFYRKMLQLRKGLRSLQYGDYRELPMQHCDLLSFIRENGNEKLLIVLNMGKGRVKFSLDHQQIKSICFTTDDNGYQINGNVLIMNKYQGMIISI